MESRPAEERDYKFHTQMLVLCRDYVGEGPPGGDKVIALMNLLGSITAHVIVGTEDAPRAFECYLQILAEQLNTIQGHAEGAHVEYENLKKGPAQ
jgi:hypothetical protein